MVLVLKLPSPLYVASIVWVPTDRPDVLMLAWPLLERLAGEPYADPSIMNCTVPVGVPEPGALAITVAVNVTD